MKRFKSPGSAQRPCPVHDRTCRIRFSSAAGIPGPSSTGLRQFFGLFARLERRIAFEAIDDRPVDLVFLLLIPENAGDEHLVALACVSRHLRHRDVADALRSAETSAELYELLTVSS